MEPQRRALFFFSFLFLHKSHRTTTTKNDPHLHSESRVSKSEGLSNLQDLHQEGAWTAFGHIAGCSKPQKPFSTITFNKCTNYWKQMDLDRCLRYNNDWKSESYWRCQAATEQPSSRRHASDQRSGSMKAPRLSSHPVLKGYTAKKKRRKGKETKQKKGLRQPDTTRRC